MNIRSKIDLEPLGALGDLVWYCVMASNKYYIYKKSFNNIKFISFLGLWALDFEKPEKI